VIARSRIFRSAPRRSWTQDREQKNRTEWHRVVAWNSKIAATLKKGDAVHVEGERRTREYPKKVGEGKKQTEIKAYTTELYADTILLIDDDKKDAAELDGSRHDQSEEAAAS